MTVGGTLWLLSLSASPAVVGDDAEADALAVLPDQTVAGIVTGLTARESALTTIQGGLKYQVLFDPAYVAQEQQLLQASQRIDRLIPVGRRDHKVATFAIDLPGQRWRFEGVELLGSNMPGASWEMYVTKSVLTTADRAREPGAYVPSNLFPTVINLCDGSVVLTHRMHMANAHVQPFEPPLPANAYLSEVLRPLGLAEHNQWLSDYVQATFPPDTPITVEWLDDQPCYHLQRQQDTAITDLWLAADPRPVRLQRYWSVPEEPTRIRRLIKRYDQPTAVGPLQLPARLHQDFYQYDGEQVRHSQWVVQVLVSQVDEELPAYRFEHRLPLGTTLAREGGADWWNAGPDLVDVLSRPAYPGLRLPEHDRYLTSSAP